MARRRSYVEYRPAFEFIRVRTVSLVRERINSRSNSATAGAAATAGLGSTSGAATEGAISTGTTPGLSNRRRQA